MDDILTVPFIVRGKAYATGDLMFDNGRIKFRYPDPRNILGIALEDGAQLRRDFANTSVSGIIRFLSEAGKLMTLENAHMREACEFSTRYSALPPSIVKGSFDLIPVVFSKIALRAMVENEIGSKYLDGWVNLPYAEKKSRTRAYGMRTLHFISGNVPVVAALSMVRAALIKADNVIKVAINDPFTTQAILQAFMQVDPKHPVTQHFAAIYWSNDMADFEQRLVQPSHFEKIISWGGALGGVNSTISHANLSNNGIDVIELGPKFSVAMLGKEAFSSPTEIDKVAKLTAKDTFSFNQQSCGSTRYHFIEATSDQAKQYADRLNFYMHLQPENMSTACPRQMPLDVRECIDVLRYDTENFYVVGGENGAGSVVVSLIQGEPADFFPVDNNVNIVLVNQLEDAVHLLHPSVQTISIYPESLKEGLYDLLVSKGAARFISIGHTVDYSVGGPFNHTEIMRRACRWVLDEQYPSKPALPFFALSKVGDILKHHL